MMRMTTQHVLMGTKIVKEFGVVSGSVVKSRNVMWNMWNIGKSLLGIELHEVTALVNENRDVAQQRMCENARILGANGIIGVRYQVNSLGNGISEAFCVGTAVQISECAETCRSV